MNSELKDCALLYVTLSKEIEERQIKLNQVQSILYKNLGVDEVVRTGSENGDAVQKIELKNRNENKIGEKLLIVKVI